MRRGTPAAKLFGEILFVLRGERTMRQISDVLDQVGATVSNSEKAIRAVKEAKIPIWAKALGVDEESLHDLWFLAQGWVKKRGSEKRYFYTETNEVPPELFLAGKIQKTLAPLISPRQVHINGTSEGPELLVADSGKYHYRILVPEIQEFTPIMRNRGVSVIEKDLISLIQELTGPERSRVRGYIDGLIEAR